MKEQYYVIGDPIEHSLSPAIYNQLFAMYGMEDECAYGRKRVTKETLSAFLDSIPADDIRGFNITMPLKEDIIPHITYADPSTRFGANTIVVKEDGLYGYSTDAQGFRKSLLEHGRRYEGNNVVFIGCGGAARALIWDCLQHSPQSVTILNRTRSKAAIFEEDPRVQVESLDDIARFMPTCNILINATPIGMHGVDARFETLRFISQLPADAFVADLIYNPYRTPFLMQAELSGHAVMNGLGMLIWQALYAFEKYTGVEPEVAAYEVLEAHLT